MYSPNSIFFFIPVYITNENYFRYKETVFNRYYPFNRPFKRQFFFSDSVSLPLAIIIYFVNSSVIDKNDQHMLKDV